MASPKTITIIGGGLAGLTLGIGLRQRNVPATIWEAGVYPRHRVCGEFISGNGQAVLQRLGLVDRCRRAGAIEAATAMFVSGRTRSPVRKLPAPALCLSRYKLDAVLAERFQELGGELKIKSRWTNDANAEGVVRATGRLANPGRKPSGWFGVKAHVSRGATVHLEADLEMHVSHGGYVGVNRIGDGEVNVCGLLRMPANGPGRESKTDWLRGEKTSLLNDRLGSVEFEADSFCSVAGLDLRPRAAAETSDCCIGDTLTMTPPVTGNGMSMAFESAEIAIEPLREYCEGRSDWRETQRLIAQRCDTAFAKRLAWARLLQWMMTSPMRRGPLGVWLLRSEALWGLLFARTR